jgi:hypothetical protein
MIEIIISDPLVLRCREYADSNVEAYATGKHSAFSVSHNGKLRSADDPQAQFVGKLCECAAAIAVDLDPIIAVQWQTVSTDYGHDLTFRDWRIEVKGSDHPNAHCLLWPIAKLKSLAHMRCDTLLLFAWHDVTTRNRVQLRCFCSVSMFRKHHMLEHPSRPHGLTPGTPYLHETSPFVTPADRLPTLKPRSAYVF